MAGAEVIELIAEDVVLDIGTAEVELADAELDTADTTLEVPELAIDDGPGHPVPGTAMSCA